MRAEALIDRWGGHAGTSGKRIRFNGQPWLTLPELGTTPPGERPECFMFQDNPVIAVPLEHLREGPNTFEGTCGEQICHSFGWGQWGWYSLVLRIYYDSSKDHPTGEIAWPTRGDSFGDNPTIRVNAFSQVGVSRVDVLGFYEGADEDGDGLYRDWHRYYQGTSLTYHVGSALTKPWEVTWNTAWVPDQQAGSVKLLARIRSNRGIWFVTDEVSGLSLVRDSLSVRLYKPHSVPQKFSVRTGKTMFSLVNIPGSAPLDRAVEAVLVLRTWNGYEDSFLVNDSYTAPIGGHNHFFKYDLRPIPISDLITGENKISFTSPTVHHGPEILWPGPAILLRIKNSGTE